MQTSRLFPLGTVLESIDLKRGTGTAVPVPFLLGSKACAQGGDAAGDGESKEHILRHGAGDKMLSGISCVLQESAKEIIR